MPAEHSYAARLSGSRKVAPTTRLRRSRAEASVRDVARSTEPYSLSRKGRARASRASSIWARGAFGFTPSAS